MGFFDTLVANPSGGRSSVYNPGGGSSYDASDALAIKKQRDLMDMENEQKMANFGSELSLRQGRLRQLYADPNRGYGTPGNPSGQPNVVFKDNNPDITPLQNATLDVQKERFKDERGDRAFAQDQAAKRTNIASGNLELEKKKNQQIFDTKQADLERKATEAANREQLARDQMKGRENDAARIAAHRDAALAATNAQHELDMHRKDAQMEESKREFQQKMDEATKKREQGEETTTSTEITDDQGKKTTTTKRGRQNSGNDPLGIR